MFDASIILNKLSQCIKTAVNTQIDGKMKNYALVG